MDTPRTHGFTLLELMVTLFIASILLGLAVPSFQQMTTRNRLVTYTNDFITTVNIARSEAVRRSATVAICRTNNGTSCGGSWNTGWLAFVDANNDGVVGAAAVEPVLRVHEGLGPKYSLATDPVFANRITYSADGASSASGVLALCHDGDVEGSRAIVITRMRPRVATDTDGDQVPNLDAGNMEDCEDPSGL
jgi:type IV fimbrial biogenesis protein FimT